MTSYYIDTCILNLWQKEVGFSGVKYWEIAKKYNVTVSFPKEIIR